MSTIISIEPNAVGGAAPRSLVRRAHDRPALMASSALALVSFVLLDPPRAAAGDNNDTAELRRIVKELQIQNRALSKRLGVLEAERGERQARTRPATARERAAPAPADTPPPMDLSTTAAAASGAPPTLPEPRDTRKLGLNERVKELEVAWAANENATQQIIRDTLSKTGPKINSYLALSGVIDFKVSRSNDFNAPTKDQLVLNTAELDFDIKVSDWLTGSLVLAFDSGSSATFGTTTGTVSRIDRFTLDRTHILVGDMTRFPITARVGREVLHFGTSTGVARLDTLSINGPLTTEIFENRQTAAGFEFAWPTPPLAPLPAPHVVPPVRPLVLAPFVGQVARALGYMPLPERPARPVPVRAAAAPPPLYGSIMFYKGSEFLMPDSKIGEEFNASVGYRTSGHCGRPYEELRSSLVCPWTIDVHVDYNTSVFESKFLELAYRPFLNQIGRVPGMAGSVKTSFGPFAVVGEVNSAIRSTTFLDGLGISRTITPTAWQASIAYQFDWNPWITEIGAQGNFISVAYSGSRDMAGVTGLVNIVPTRIGFVPETRLAVTAGEWPMDGLKVAVEYSANWDYPISAGGTGQLAHGVFGLIQLNF